MKKLAAADQNRCAACGACSKVCPRGAVSVFRGCHAVVEETRCVGCGLCAKVCSAACITVEERSGVR